jgi:hypothetical protein
MGGTSRRLLGYQRPQQPPRRPPRDQPQPHVACVSTRTLPAHPNETADAPAGAALRRPPSGGIVETPPDAPGGGAHALVRPERLAAHALSRPPRCAARPQLRIAHHGSPRVFEQVRLPQRVLERGGERAEGLRSWRRGGVRGEDVLDEQWEEEEEQVAQRVERVMPLRGAVRSVRCSAGGALTDHGDTGPADWFGVVFALADDDEVHPPCFA